MKPILEAVKVAKRFGGMVAVKEVSLSIGQGEAVAVIGSNGAGKTTFFNMLSGLFKPSAGTILLEGVEITHLMPDERARLGIARTMQITSVFPDLTVDQNVRVALLRPQKPWMAFSIQPQKQKENIATTQKILELVGLRHLANVRCGDLAYGDQRLVEVAIALGCNPKVLLLDEPTAGLSPAESDSITAQLKYLHMETGISLVVIEHDMDVVRNLAQRVAMFHLGQCIMVGDPDTVMNDPMVHEIYLGKEHVTA